MPYSRDALITLEIRKTFGFFKVANTSLEITKLVFQLYFKMYKNMKIELAK